MSYKITNDNFLTDENYFKTKLKLSNLLNLYHISQTEEGNSTIELTDEVLEELTDNSIVRILILFKKREFEYIAWETLTNIIRGTMSSYYRKASHSIDENTSLEYLTTNEEGEEMNNFYLATEDEKDNYKLKATILKEKVGKLLSPRHFTLLTLLENWKNRGQCKTILKCSYETINKMLAEIKEIY